MVSCTPECVTHVRRFLYIFALGFPVFLAFTGAAGIMTIQVKVGASTTETNNNTSIAFMGIYMIIFAALMFIYECCVICPISIVDNWMKKNFGFMYGPIGRGLFTILAGVFAFGLERPYQLKTACGVLVAAWGGVQIALSMAIPDLYEKVDKYAPRSGAGKV